MKNVFRCITMSNDSEDKIDIDWPICGITSLMGATQCPCSEPSGV